MGEHDTVTGRLRSNRLTYFRPAKILYRGVLIKQEYDLTADKQRPIYFNEY